ncbi:MAG: glutamate--cysteine ligase [Halobacteriovoraceae bacterium]|nr:glutamate--cysteine ligase [Halobacteriovoraceae bacterium]|tara:strand:+ start:17958 stop:19487 length:1530 start_codon:yes stop_codon:yes gene_type:complete
MKQTFIDDPTLVFEIRQGLERETLRTDQNAHASKSQHPEKLGSKLTHPYITTDYSENLLEFITPVFKESEELLKFMGNLHNFTFQKLDHELFWPFSMPAILPEDQNEIPLAYFGESNVGKLKTLYRNGLGHRYGRAMQSISGVHYNFSFTDRFWKMIQEETSDKKELGQVKSEGYFHIIRNFQRYRWMLMYFFGASPVVHKSFLEGKDHDLEPFAQDSFVTPTGTSLRMGGLGYTSAAQASIKMCYNQLETYVHAIERARLTPYPPYEKIGLKKGEEYLQLNTHILQIDNEFYTNIRPKNVARSRESALQALHSRGVEYLEVRLLDNDPFHPLGISEDSIAFLHLFLIWCFSKESPQLTGEQCDEADQKFEKVVLDGRKKGMKFFSDGSEVSMKDELMGLLTEMAPLVRKLAQVDPIYQEAYEIQLEKLTNPSKMPSQKVVDEVSRKGFVQLGLSLAERYSYQMRENIALDSELEDLSLSTWKDEAKIREEDTRSFDEFLEYYFKKIKI